MIQVVTLKPGRPTPEDCLWGCFEPQSDLPTSRRKLARNLVHEMPISCSFCSDWSVFKREAAALCPTGVWIRQAAV